jgi:hypothetical protein
VLDVVKIGGGPNRVVGRDALSLNLFLAIPYHTIIRYVGFTFNSTVHLCKLFVYAL